MTTRRDESGGGLDPHLDAATETSGSGAESRGWWIETTQRLLQLQQAVRLKQISFPASEAVIVDEVMATRLLPGELLDPARLSSSALGLVRTAAMALRIRTKHHAEGDDLKPIGRAEGQAELFRHFAELFAALTGKSYDAFASIDEMAAATRRRAQKEPKAMMHAYEQACDALAKFYQMHAKTLWSHAREAGGLKLVLGGQRMFGPSAFAGVRKMALYADTQLVADPIFPFFERDLDLAEKHNDLLRQLYDLLQLSPLMAAQLPVPPVIVFPSFEKLLEDNDVQTQIGIFDLVRQTVAVACNATFASMDELVEFARTQPDKFVVGVMRAQLFIPPGVMPGELTDPKAAVQRYFAEAAKHRNAESVRAMSGLPMSAVMFTGIAERFAPQYHLLENANELIAQPMLTQMAHWHFFEKAAGATATDLHRKDVISTDALQALQALQHARLAWLNNVPMPALVELLANQENLAFRKELSEHTKNLSAAGPADLDRTVREVCHSIEAMVQKHQKAITDIDAKYAPKYTGTWLTGGAAVGLGVGAMFMPMLAVFGPAAPLVAGTALLGKLAIDKVQQAAEVRRARSSLLGVLAATPRS